MAHASRHGGAPFANTETLDGGDLETDIANVYAQVNGNLDDTNVKTGANIAGTKVINIPRGSMAANACTNADFVEDLVGAADISTSLTTLVTTSGLTTGATTGTMQAIGVVSLTSQEAANITVRCELQLDTGSGFSAVHSITVDILGGTIATYKTSVTLIDQVAASASTSYTYRIRAIRVGGTTDTGWTTAKINVIELGR